LKGSWPWPWIGSYCISSCITYRPLRTCQMSLKSKKLFVDGWTDVRTFEIGFIRSTLSKSRPENSRGKQQATYGSDSFKQEAQLSLFDALSVKVWSTVAKLCKIVLEKVNDVSIAPTRQGAPPNFDPSLFPVSADFAISSSPP